MPWHTAQHAGVPGLPDFMLRPSKHSRNMETCHTRSGRLTGLNPALPADRSFQALVIYSFRLCLKTMWKARTKSAGSMLHLFKSEIAFSNGFPFLPLCPKHRFTRHNYFVFNRLNNNFDRVLHPALKLFYCLCTWP